MTLHLFNPSHDEALAANYPYYYPSNMARRLQAELGALPVLWAAEGDAVLVDDAAPAQTESPAHCFPGVRFVTARQMNADFWSAVDRIDPWGWDLLVRHRLRKLGAPEELLPDDAQLARIRQLSSRETTAEVLPALCGRLQCAGIGVTGASRIVRSWGEAEAAFAEWPSAFVKSLWSCSGRGVFRVNSVPTASDAGRLRRLLREQGGAEVQKACVPLIDFAMEFEIDAAGRVAYLGLSTFATNASGGYGGNMVAPQAHIEELISDRLGRADWRDPLAKACTAEFSSRFAGRYTGPFGVDMMVAQTKAGPAVFPCVEVNLRRTMGHAALCVEAERELVGAIRGRSFFSSPPAPLFP